MSSRFPRPLLSIAMLAAFVLAGASSAGLAQSPQRSDETSLCVYHDRTYSEGAAICAQTRFMLMCSADAGKLVWKPVADRSLAERCLRPTVAAEPPVEARPPRRHRIARTLPPPPPVAATSAKCFTFNGKRYCE